MELKIERCEENEIRKLVEDLWLKLARERAEDHKYNELAENNLIERSFEHKQNLFDQEDSAIYVAKDGEELIGHMVVKITERPPVFKINEKLSIHELFVKETHRGKGIGKKLIQKAEKFAEAREISFIGLSVDIPNEEAYGFYNSLGFEQYRRKMAKDV